MNSAAKREQFLDRSEPVEILVNGESVTMPYRRAVGLVSLGRAQWPEKKPVAKKAAKK